MKGYTASLRTSKERTWSCKTHIKRFPSPLKNNVNQKVMSTKHKTINEEDIQLKTQKDNGYVTFHDQKKMNSLNLKS